MLGRDAYGGVGLGGRLTVAGVPVRRRGRVSGVCSIERLVALGAVVGGEPGPAVDLPEGVEISPRQVRLTERERQVLSYLALGWETRYIAEESGLSPHTARNQNENLRVKLRASSRPEAVMVAMRRG